MKKNWLKIIVFACFIWLSWACGIADAFVADDIESIEDPKERAWAWKVEWFFQEEGRYPTESEKDSMRREFESTWRDTTAATQEQPKTTTKKTKRPKAARQDSAPPPPPEPTPPAPDTATREE